MRLLTILLPLCVGLALAAGWARARFGAPETDLPSFSPARPPAFEPLAPPLGGASLTGRVVDPQGSPVEGASVYLRAWGVPHWAYSDSDGRFRLGELPAEELDLVVLAWPHPIGRFRATPGGAPAELRLDPLEPPPPDLPELAYRPLAGRVLGAGSAWGDPNGYEVVLTPAAPPDTLQAAVERRVATDASGAFALPDLAHGDYRVSVLPAWARGGTWPDLAASWSRELIHDLESPAEIEVQLAAGAIEGRLWGDPSFRPIEGAFCLVVDAADPSKIWPPVVSSDEGRFRVRTLPPGQYLLSARAGEGMLVDIPVEVRPGEVARPDLEPLRVRRREVPGPGD